MSVLAQNLTVVNLVNCLLRLVLNDVFTQAYREALWLGHNFVGTEHVLLALCPWAKQSDFCSGCNEY
jgi:hypothetical protein